MKDLKNLNGAKTISKSEQRGVKGGVLPGSQCKTLADCPDGFDACVPLGNRSVCFKYY